MDQDQSQLAARESGLQFLLKAGSLTGGSSFVLGYLAQTLHLLVSTSINIIVPLALGPSRYAIVIALTGPGYLAPIVVDQFLNTRLAFDAGAGSQRLLGRVAFLKLLVTGPAVAIVWLVFSRSPTSLFVGVALAASFGLSTLLDAWLLATGRSVLLVFSKVVLLILMTVVTLLAVHRGPLAVSIGFVIAYSASGLTCLALAVREKGWHLRPRIAVSSRTIGLSGPMLWQAAYSWLVPLVLVAKHADRLASNYKLAVGVAVMAFTLTPVPSLLVVAIAGRGREMMLAADAALRRAVVLGAAGAVATFVTLALNSQLFSEVLGRFRYGLAVSNSQVICLAVFPLLLNPLLTARLYSALSPAWGPIVLFAAVYLFSLIGVEFYPGWAPAIVPLGQWLLFCWLAFRNRRFLLTVRTVASKRVVGILLGALFTSGLVALIPTASVSARATITSVLLLAIVAASVPYLRGGVRDSLNP